MNALIESVPQLMAYTPALVSLAVLCVMVLVQAFLTAPLAFVSQEQAPGMPLVGDHSLLSFRAVRTHANSVESFPAFAAALLLAIVAGVGASIVNWLAAIHVLFRLLFWVVYYSGIGKVAGGPRTLCYVGGLLSNIGLAAVALYALAW